jgi:hypothetical protein
MTGASKEPPATSIMKVFTAAVISTMGLILS